MNKKSDEAAVHMKVASVHMKSANPLVRSRMGGDPASKDKDIPAPLSRTLDDLNTEIVALGNTLDALDSKIQPILVPVIKAQDSLGEVGGSAPRAPGSSITETISSRVDTLYHIRTRLNEIINRLDL